MKTIVVSLFALLLSLMSCTDSKKVDKEHIFDELNRYKSEAYSLDNNIIRRHIHDIAQSEHQALSMDRFTDLYYNTGKPFIWITKTGVNNQADSLLNILKNADECGIDTSIFNIYKIKKDINSIRNLSFKSNPNLIMARIEYYLTKAFFRYSGGQRYGFVNPNHIYNNIEKYDVDSVTKKYRQLCNYKLERADTTFYNRAVSEVRSQNINKFINDIQPKSKLYSYLIKRLNTSKTKSRAKTICNIERCRWRFKQGANCTGENKSVTVNIPSFSLITVNNNSMRTMNVGCGTVSNKTPLLDSKITRMDINPQWIVPKSIAKGYIGRNQYMHNMEMFVYDKASGKLPPESVSYAKIMEGKQYIIQAGGKKNSLGRIIFRFDNNFSVFLHDTSSPWLLQRKYRAISHGCVRVEKPLELALFLLNENKTDVTDKIKYSMTVELSSNTDSVKRKKIDRKRMINTINIKPAIPLFITYYTIFYDRSGNFSEFDDVYGFDEVLSEKLKPFMK